ncbi:MAG: hypothetical protein QM736_11540 [Vicinamibacterales bacterium]
MQTRITTRTGRARPIVFGLLALAIASGALRPQPLGSEPLPSGTITGHVRLTTRMRGVPISTNAYAPRAVGKQATPGVPEMRSVVVYLKDVRYSGPLQTSTAEIRQEGESFSPRVVAITRGSTVDFPNLDLYFHNVFSLSRAGTFDLGRYPAGQTRSRQFDKPGLVKVYCHLHSQMSATIVVLDHPYFVIPNADGQFTLPNVPPGDYTLVGWHERVGEQTSRISVSNGTITTTTISLPVDDAR